MTGRLEINVKVVDRKSSLCPHPRRLNQEWKEVRRQRAKKEHQSQHLVYFSVTCVFLVGHFGHDWCLAALPLEALPWLLVSDPYQQDA